MASQNPFGDRGWTPERMSSLEGKTLVITGANAGTGFEAAKLLAKLEGPTRQPDSQVHVPIKPTTRRDLSYV